jgi:hypothetical protein
MDASEASGDGTRPTGRLYHELVIRQGQLDHYYHVLNEDADLRAALQALAEGWPIFHVHDPMSLPVAFRRRLDVFAEQWALPRKHGLDDLWWSLQCAWHGEVLKMRSSGVWWVSYDADTITPYSPQPFSYDPAKQNHDWLRERAEQEAEKVRQSILAQGLELERQWGEADYRRLPPQFHDPEKLKVGALRLYRRAVLKWSWSKIAKADDGVPAGSSTVRSSVACPPFRRRHTAVGLRSTSARSAGGST